MADKRDGAGVALIGALEQVLESHAGGRIAVSGQARICHDLHIGGDDAWELID